MSAKYERRSFSVYPVASKVYQENFNFTMQNSNTQEKEKEFRTTTCNKCHIKITTSNDCCPCCNQKVDFT